MAERDCVIDDKASRLSRLSLLGRGGLLADDSDQLDRWFRLKWKQEDESCLACERLLKYILLGNDS